MSNPFNVLELAAGDTIEIVRYTDSFETYQCMRIRSIDELAQLCAMIQRHLARESGEPVSIEQAARSVT